MRKSVVLGIIELLTIILWSIPPVSAADLPASLKIDLKRLEEAWNILDQYAEKIWPGWTKYQEVPFLFEYPNGIEMLVGHPDPIDGFVPVPGIEVLGKKVFIDRRREIALPLDLPMQGGGGPGLFGKTRPVPTVRLKMNLRLIADQPSLSAIPANADPAAEELKRASENQLLINIHELFHCFQREFYQYRYGNIEFNPDANYAIYAEIEGLALEKAYLEENPSKAKEYLKDFLTARQLKRQSMLEIERNQESEDELMEGTAVFAETMVLQLIKSGYRPKIGSGDDPGFGSFQNLNGLIDQKLKDLQKNRVISMTSRDKCYSYGSFQALLLNRYFSGWQQRVVKDKMLLDQILRDSISISPEEQKEIANRLARDYPLDEISQRHTRAIRKRDDAYDGIRKRTGKSFVVNFKPAQEYLNPQARGEFYRLGLINIYPQGIENVRIQKVLFEGRESPMVSDQLYYIKWIDPQAPGRGKGYKIKFSRKEEGGIYYDAEFSCGGFVLRAPQLQVIEGSDRVKVTVLKKM
jgi:hypothetical protein